MDRESGRLLFRLLAAGTPATPEAACACASLASTSPAATGPAPATPHPTSADPNGLAPAGLASALLACDDRSLGALVALAGWHGVTPALWGLLGSALGREVDRLPPDHAAFLEAASHFNRRRNARLVGQAEEIAGAVAGAGLVPVFLKGTAHLLSGLHPDPAMRVVGDIDLLVAPDRLEAAAAALVAAGYRRLPDRVALAHDPLRLVRDGRPALVELHQAPVAFVLAPALDAAGVLARARPAPGRPEARIPCLQDMIVHLLAHGLLQDHGLRLGEFKLRDAVDLARLAARHAGAIDWTAVEDRLARVPGGRDAFAFGLLATRAALPGAAVPAPAASPRAARRAAAWSRRFGRPAGAVAGGATFLAIYASDCLWRLRHAPDERRRLFRRALSPAAWPGLARSLAAVAAEGPPATRRGPAEPRP